MMNSLESAIKHYEEKAEALENTADVHAWNDDGYSELECLNSAKEHRQLAKWLRELRESRIVLDILGQFLVDLDIDVCCEDLTMTDDYCAEYCDNQKPLCWYRWAKLKAREANADEDSD